MRNNLVHLKSTEKMFFSQKLKCDYFKDCDRGTSFFHAIIGQKQCQRFIASIVSSNGVATTSESEVGAEFVKFYQNLLGVSKETTSLDMDVIRCGPCLASSAHDGLLAPFSGDDIKVALFSIGNDKAPGPDGYSAFFFKRAWDIVGSDFVLAVQNFFSSGKMLKQINHSIIALIPKSANASYPSDFRPISCCNVIYKVISKLL